MRAGSVLFITVAWTLIFFALARADQGDIVINEVLADPADESTGEFVELFNRSDLFVDLAGWRLTDRSDSNDTIIDYQGVHDRGLEGTVVPPGGFALIVDPDYGGEYGGALSAVEDQRMLIVVTVSGDRTLGNGLGNRGDMVNLIGKDGWRVSFTWLQGAGSERSWEKVDIAGNNSLDNWSPARLDDPITPGRRNSVAPPRFDLAVADGGILIVPAHPAFDDLVNLRATVRNAGTESVHQSRAEAYSLSRRDDQLGDEPVVLGRAELGPMAPGGSREFLFNWLVRDSGLVSLTFRIVYKDDERQDNNVAVLSVEIPFPRGALAVNELMFDPADGASEWIEVVNSGNRAVDLAGWTVETADPTRRRIITKRAASLPSGGYAVIVADLPQFQVQYGSGTELLLEPDGSWPSLLNAGTKVVIRDPTGLVVDEILYSRSWSEVSGVSAERINPDLPSLDERSWGPSSAGNGATPGKPNSIYSEAVPGELKLSARPNPFTPDSDERHDAVTLSAIIPSPRALVRARLYDTAGRLVKLLVSERQIGVRWSAVWDGTTDGGVTASVGAYILLIEVRDQLTDAIWFGKSVIVVAGNF